MRFVLLQHQGTPTCKPGVHWDLMLEAEGGLRTWALTEPPAAGKWIAAEQLAEHRLAYLEYEGPLSDDRGTVTRDAWGEFTIVRETPLEIVVSLTGEQLRGEITLSRPTEDTPHWRLQLEEKGDATRFQFESRPL